MRSFALSLLLTLFSSGVASSTAAAAPGAPPPFALADLDGKAVTLASYRGVSPVLVVFYRGWW
jgi:hypothetical protein